MVYGVILAGLYKYMGYYLPTAVVVRVLAGHNSGK